MKIRPYRVCDVCKKEYDKTHGAMKVKMLNDPMGYCQYYGDLPIMERMDICPVCSGLMLKWISEHIGERSEE